MNEKATAVVQARDVKGLDQHGRNGAGDKGFDYEFILKVQSTGFYYGLYLECERKIRVRMTPEFLA